MPRGKVIYMALPYTEILADHPREWVLIRIVDRDKETGVYVASAPQFNALEIQVALRQEHDAGRDVALRFAGSLFPEDSVVVF